MLQTAILGCLLLAAAAEETASQLELQTLRARMTRAERPDVVLIVVDTLRPDYLGCYGHPTANTPNIDTLASEGVLFENAFSHIPITGPSHASLFLSQLPSEHGVLNNLVEPMPESAPALAEILSVAGYRNSGVISIHPIVGEYAYDRGFDEYVDDTGLVHIQPGDLTRERALEQQANLDDPFFHFVHFADPHEPYDAHGLVKHTATILLDGEEIAEIETSDYQAHEIPLSLPLFRGAELSVQSDYPFRVRELKLQAPRWMRPSFERPQWGKNYMESVDTRIGAMGTRWPQLQVALMDRVPAADLQKRYRREVEFVDRQIGGVLEDLRARGLYENSWIVFTSDHGEALGCHGYVGHVDTLYDCMMRVPLIFRPPISSSEVAGSRRQEVASLIDVAPTLLVALGLPLPSTATGEDLFARGETDRSDAAVLLETHAPQAQHTMYALRTNAEKIIWTPDSDNWELYDLTADPAESVNLCEGEEPKDAEIHRRFVALLEQLYDPSAAADTQALDEETRGILRSLGYIE